jgi:diguanylate cyclase (GGDEF)-like protein/PAS domain S-box-containing protein
MLLEQFSQYKTFCKSLLDAYVVIDDDGMVQASNQAFGLLVGKSTKQLLGKMALDNLIEFTDLNHRNFLLDLQALKKPSRYDELRARTIVRHQEKIFIIGVFPFFSSSTGENNYLGSLLHIRDITAEASLQGKYVIKSIESITDPLTGLKSRAIMSSLDAVFEKDMRHGILLLDIDHFKSVNDEFGHPCGDYILKELADVMKNFFGSRPTIIRYGGEEFLVIIPAVGLQLAKAVAQSLIGCVESHHFQYEGIDHRITISCGVIAANPNISKEALEEHVSLADKALYSAKNSGRNRAHYVYKEKVLPAASNDSLVQVLPKVTQKFLSEAPTIQKAVFWNQRRADTLDVLSTSVEKWAEESSYAPQVDSKFVVSKPGQLESLTEYCKKVAGTNQRPGLYRALQNITEEMYTNILYDAPRASLRGNPKEDELKKRFRRGSDLVLSASEQGSIDIEEHGSFWQVTATDPWGSFTPESFWHHYAKSQEVDPAFRKNSEVGQGAGLGLLRILYYGSIVVCRVWPGKRTELIVFVSKTKPNRPLSAQDRSAAYFKYSPLNTTS